MKFSEVLRINKLCNCGNKMIKIGVKLVDNGKMEEAREILKITSELNDLIRKMRGEKY